MKKLLILILPFVVMGCAYQVAPPRVVSDNIIQQKSDEKHELIVMDSGFESWFLTHAKPMNYYALSYYESHNAQYVSAWNHRARSAYGPITNTIDYDVNKSYGLEVNHKLFWYFKYIEAIYGRGFLL